MSNKQESAPPPNYAPNYPPPAHVDAGPYHPPQSSGPNQALDYYSQHDQQPYTQQQYGQQPTLYNQGYGAPQPYQGPQQQQGMYYGPQTGYQGVPPGGYHASNQGKTSPAGGICAGLLGALACCCCIDCLF